MRKALGVTQQGKERHGEGERGADVKNLGNDIQFLQRRALK